MIIVRRPILSRSDVADPRPWFDLDDDDGARVTIGRANHARAELSRVRDTARPLHAEIAQVAANNPAAELIEIVVTLSGDVEVVPAGTYPVVLAHLGWYRPATDTLDLLQFVEEGLA